MGTRNKSNGNGEARPDNQLVSTPPEILEWRWVGNGAMDGFPTATLSLQWLAEKNITTEMLENMGFYYPVYKEVLTDGTRTQATSENIIGDGTDQRNASNVLQQSPNDGGNAE